MTRKIVIIMWLMLGVAACGEKAQVQPSSTPTHTPYPLESRLERESQIQALRGWERAQRQIWEALSQGGNAACGGNYETLSPSLFEEGDPLRIATIALFEAEQLWQAECELSRPIVPPERIRLALDHLRQATLALEGQ